MPTLTDLGQLVKERYPGTYDHLDDSTLGRMVKNKYPDAYGQFSDKKEKGKKKKDISKIPARSLPVKVLQGAESAFGVASSPTAKHILGPLAKEFGGLDEDAISRIDEMINSDRTIYGSDIAQEVFPFLKSKAQQREHEIKTGKHRITRPSQIVPEILKSAGFTAQEALKTIGRFGIDILTDPLTIATFGQQTKLGALIKTAREAQQAGKPIKLTSKLAKDIAKEMGAAKVSPQAIQQFRKKYGAPARRVSEQVARGERSLVKFGPLEVKGKLVGKLIEPLSMLRRGDIGSKIENAAREILSTKSGDPDFDVLHDKMKSLLEYRYGLKYEDAKVMQKQLSDISRATGIPREKLNADIRRLGEDIKPAVTMQKGGLQITKRKYNKQIFDSIDNYYQDKLVTTKVKLTNAFNKMQKAIAKSDAVGEQKFRAIVDRESYSLAEHQGALNQLHQRYTPPPSITPEVDKIVNEQRERLAQDLLRQQTAGVQVRSMLSDRFYIPHITLPEVRKAMRDKMIRESPGKVLTKMSSKEFDKELDNAIRRQLNEVNPALIDGWAHSGLITNKTARAIKGKHGLEKLDELLEKGKITEDQFTDAVHTLSIDEVHAMPDADKMRIFGTKGVLNKKTGQYEIFHTDPVYYTTIRGVRGELARTSAEFYNEMKARGLAVEEATAPPNWVNVKPKELEGFKTSPEIARVLNRYSEFNTSSEVFSQVLKQYDKVHNLMKLWTLAPFPAYHTLNAIGNFWNNFLSGLKNPDMYRQALMTQISKVDKRYRPVNFTDIYGNKWTTDTLTEEAKKLGVIGKGQYGAEIPTTLQRELDSGKFLTLSSRQHLLRVGNRVGKFVEDNARMAHFINRLRAGDTAEQAAMSVKKYLFDYSDLTDFERQYLNRTFFFYTWTRKNIPLQLHSLVSNPAKFSLPFKAKYEIEKNVPISAQDEKYLAEYMKENFPIRIRFDAKNKNYEYFLLNRWLPAADILKLSKLHEIALQMTAPLLKEPIQQIFNYDFFFKKAIEKKQLGFMGEKEKFLGMNLPKRITHGMKTIRLLNEIDKLSAPDKDLWNKIAGILSGKVYSYNPQQGLIANAARVDEDIKVITGEIYKQAGKKRSKDTDREINRLLQLIQEKSKEY